MASEATSHSTGPHTPGAAADPNSSSSTLVNHGLTSVSAHDSAPPGSPLSPSFDPSPPTPLALRDGPSYLTTEVQLRPGATDVNALWAHRLSASFGAIADQIAAASRALAVPPSAPAANDSGGSQGEVTALAARLDVIERAQEQLGTDLQQVQRQLARLQVSGTASSLASKQKEQAEAAIVEVDSVSGTGEGTSEFKRATEIAIEELQKKVDGAIDTIKLEQARLSARLHNATVTSNKMVIKAPTMANGKPPQNFPNTKGEFEHLTKERYEYLLKSYDVMPKGDTKAKREQLREFIGLTPLSN